MREILFRGKRIDNEEWVFGSLLIDGEAHKPASKENLSFSKHYIVPETDVENIQTRFNDGAFYLNTIAYHIIPETIGQFTGLNDKNGKKIFEGDIIQYSIEEDQAVFVSDVKFGEFNPDGGALLNTNVGFYVELVDQEGKRTYMRKDIGYWVKFRGVEIIGNIHDNPELLGRTEDENKI